MGATDDFEFILTHRELRQLKAEAWDEGFDAGGMDPPAHEWSKANPYRD